MTSAEESTTEQIATIGGLPVRTHDHVCVLYRGEEQRDELMAGFLADGMRAGDRCYCMIAPDRQQRIATAVSARDDRSAEAAAADGAGRVDFIGPSGSHLDGGEFVSDRMLRFWEDWGASTFDGDVIVPIVRAHPTVWMNGVVLTNPYYMQSEHFSPDEIDELTGDAAAPG